MNEETTSRLEAWIDGELSTVDRAEIEALLERDPEARAYVERLKRIQKSLQETHRGSVDVEAAWESVEAQLEERKSVFHHWALPQQVAAIAAVMVMGILMWLPFRGVTETPSEIEWASMVDLVETDLEGATSIVYMDQPSGWTVVWVAEPEFQEEPVEELLLL